MQLWLETTDISTLEKAQRLGLLQGVYTTPTLLAASAHPRQLLETLLALQPGPIAVDVTGDMIHQGKALHAFSPRIVVKVPVTEEGWEAIRCLAAANISVMATAIFQPTQAWVATRAGARFIVPQFSRILKAGDNPLSQLEGVQKMRTTDGLTPRLLASNPKTMEQIRSCCEIGVDGVILREDVFADLIETQELTSHAVEQYEDDWKKIKSPEWF